MSHTLDNSAFLHLPSSSSLYIQQQQQQQQALEKEQHIQQHQHHQQYQPHHQQSRRAVLLRRPPPAWQPDDALFHQPLSPPPPPQQHNPSSVSTPAPSPSSSSTCSAASSSTFSPVADSQSHLTLPYPDIPAPSFDSTTRIAPYHPYAPSGSSPPQLSSSSWAAVASPPASLLSPYSQSSTSSYPSSPPPPSSMISPAASTSTAHAHATTPQRRNTFPSILDSTDHTAYSFLDTPSPTDHENPYAAPPSPPTRRLGMRPAPLVAPPPDIVLPVVATATSASPPPLPPSAPRTPRAKPQSPASSPGDRTPSPQSPSTATPPALMPHHQRHGSGSSSAGAATPKPILRRSSCPSIGCSGSDSADSPLFGRTASHPHLLRRSDSGKSLSFSSNSLERVVLFSPLDMPSEVASWPETEFVVGSSDEEEDEDDVRSRRHDEDDDDEKTERPRAPAVPRPPQPFRIVWRTPSSTVYMSLGAAVAVDAVRVEDGPSSAQPLSPFASPYPTAYTSSKPGFSLSTSSPSSAPVVVITLLLRNLAYEKRVSVRFTTDAWASGYAEVPATFAGTVSTTMGGVVGIDRFVARIDMAKTAVGPAVSTLSSLTVEFAVRAEMAGFVFWDNNGSSNHKVILRRGAGGVASALGVATDGTIDDTSGGKQGNDTTSLQPARPLNHPAQVATAEALALAAAAIMAADAARIARDFEEEMKTRVRRAAVPVRVPALPQLVAASTKTCEDDDDDETQPVVPPRSPRAPAGMLASPQPSMGWSSGRAAPRFSVGLVESDDDGDDPDRNDNPKDIPAAAAGEPDWRTPFAAVSEVAAVGNNSKGKAMSRARSSSAEGIVTNVFGFGSSGSGAVARRPGAWAPSLHCSSSPELGTSATFAAAAAAPREPPSSPSSALMGMRLAAMKVGPAGALAASALAQRQQQQQQPMQPMQLPPRLTASSRSLSFSGFLSHRATVLPGLARSPSCPVVVLVVKGAGGGVGVGGGAIANGGGGAAATGAGRCGAAVAGGGCRAEGPSALRESA
ncbi:hypothetical protein DFJ73DRAFT_68277 [Zopfochytrium polystomum]|nr:hypothetical protein DFJ73DRAFT_68277 [Zopfochytrium polystomum]